MIIRCNHKLHFLRPAPLILESGWSPTLPLDPPLNNKLFLAQPVATVTSDATGSHLAHSLAQKLTLFSASSFEDIVKSRRAWGTREKMQKRKTLFSILLKNDWSFLWVHKTIRKDVARTLGRSVMWRDKNGWEGDSFEGGLLEWGEGRGGGVY